MSEPMPEQWVPIVNCAGYEVSDQGRVRHVKMLKPVLVSDSYLAVGLPTGKGRGTRLRYVHRLVAAAFIGPCPPGQQVRHGPNGTLDNRAAQLCYGTQISNEGDKLRDGTLPRGEGHYSAKLTNAIVAECRARVAGGEPIAQLAREFSVGWEAMNSAVKGTTWATCPADPVLVKPKSIRPTPRPKLDRSVIAECRQRYASGESAKKLAAEFGVHRNTMYRALHDSALK